MNPQSANIPVVSIRYEESDCFVCINLI